MEYKPYYYQSYAKDFIIDHEAAGLFLDMGMGKTVVSLTAAEELLHDYFAVKKVLVIAPLRPAKETWPTEAKKWDHLRALRFSLILGSRIDREHALAAEADIYITNRENVVWLVQELQNAWPFDMVILDELSSFKSSKAQRFRALKRVRKHIKRIVGLTGTPAPNGLLDLWPEMYLLDQGKSLGRTVTGYRDMFFLPDKRNATTIFSWKPKTGAEEEIFDLIKPVCVSMKAADYLQLPERLIVDREVMLSEKAMKTYKQLERDTLLPFADGDIDAPTAAVLTNKLMQAGGGAAYDENGNVKRLHDDKLDALDEQLEAANGQPVLVFYQFKHELARIRDRHPEAVEIREAAAIDRWNAGEIPLLLAHPASAGHGLNLQFGGHIIIWYTLPTSLELYQQANKRLHRPGQPSTVVIIRLIAKDCYDERVAQQILASKQVRQDTVLEAIKARIKEVTK